MASVHAELWRVTSQHSTAQADRVNRLDGQTLLIDASELRVLWPYDI